MYLRDRISTIPQDQILSELDALLNRSLQVHTSYSGVRKVSIQGFEKAISIDAIAKKYLEDITLNMSYHPTVETRLHSLAVGDKISSLCFRGQDGPQIRFFSFSLHSFFFLLSPFLEPSLSELEEKREHVFYFYPDEFQTLFPGQKPLAVHGSNSRSEKWKASFEMMQEYLSKRNDPITVKR